MRDLRLAGSVHSAVAHSSSSQSFSLLSSTSSAARSMNCRDHIFYRQDRDRVSPKRTSRNARAQLETSKDVSLQFMLVQALDVLGKKAEALKLLEWCMRNGTTPPT